MEIQGQLSNEKKNTKTRVKVAIRVRPMVPRQIANNEPACVAFPSNDQIIIGNDRQYKFDRVFNQKSQQSEVYQTCVQDLILGCFDGYNAAVLAYGQTGSGKTFTMGTAATDLENYSEMGMIPRVIRQIFLEVEKRKKKAEFIVKASFLQIYNEQIIDLLSNDPQKFKKQSSITIRQEKDGSMSIYGAVQEKVTDAEQMASLLQKGSLHRTTKQTEMNSTSSRSHAIFLICIQQHLIQDLYQDKGKEVVDQGFMTAKFFFVDLAGSERAKKTGATGTLLKEGININLGLLQLGNVISSLATIEKKEGQFITYRNSKLTRILQDCLGGNSNTYMIACVSPAQSNYDQSLNTLKYASKAMNIKNKPVINRDPQSALISQLRQKIFQLEQENRKIRQLMTQSGVKVQDADIGQSKDLISQDLRRLKMLYVSLQKKYDEATAQMRQQTKRKNELSIENYELRRQKDLSQMKLQSIRARHPELFQTEEQDEKRQSLLEQYNAKIAKLEVQLKDKDQLCVKLEVECEKLHKISQKDQKILIQKSKSLYVIHKENRTLKKQVQKLRKQVDQSSKGIQSASSIPDSNKEPLNESRQNETDRNSLDSEGSSDTDQIKEQFQAQILSGCREHDESFERTNDQNWCELKSMDKCIEEKENCLNAMTNSQIQLQYQLIEQMKQEYHQKVMMLERQKQTLVTQKDSIAGGEKTKLNGRIQNLEGELKEFRKKMKEQRNIEKVVSTQNVRIKELATEIKKFKVQKIQLTRKLKEDKQIFQKFKMQKVRDLMRAKRQNMKKQNQLKKATVENKRHVRHLNKKNEELKKAKKLNETIRAFMKGNGNKKGFLSSNRESEQTQVGLTEKECQQIVRKCIEQMMLSIEQEIQITRYQAKVDDIETQIQQLLFEESKDRLKLDRLRLSIESSEAIQLSQEGGGEEEELNMSIMDVRERISNLEESLDFYKNKYNGVVGMAVDQFDLENEVIYNRLYDSAHCLRGLLISLFRSMYNALVEDSRLRDIKQKNQTEIKTLAEQINDLKSKIQMMSQDYQQNLTKLREEMIIQCYSSYQEPDTPTQTTSSALKNLPKIQDREKKVYEKKIVDLTKNNRQLSADVQMWRRKCGIIQDKYQSMRMLFNKDKFIGRPRQEETSFVKDKRLNHSLNTRSMAMMEEVNSLLDNFNANQSFKLKKGHSYEDQIENSDRSRTEGDQIQQTDFNKNKWECLGKIDAHNSPVLSLTTHANMLISTATKSLRIWDLETSKIISDLSGPHLSGFVKYVIVCPERRIMATACDKVITLWDLITLNVEGQLRAHKDEVRTMHIVGDYMFSGGKGNMSGGSLLAWDFRNLNPNSAMEQKEKNQDVFTMTSHNNTLYYGTRNHQVRRMNLESMEILTPFEPPHMDTVTGLGVSKGYLISGSKDKNLRLWSLDSNSNNIKYTIHAFNDYITTVQSDPSLPIFYSGARDGQVKIGSVSKDKINVVGGIMAHTQSVNSVCPLDVHNNILATGSSDKTIKIWQPTSETVSQLQSQQ